MTDPTPPRAEDHQEREALLPCPFCGATNAILHRGDDRYWTVECGDCEGRMLHPEQSKAIEWWNRRVAPEPVREAMPPDPLPHAYGAHFAQPEPQQQGGEDYARGWNDAIEAAAKTVESDSLNDTVRMFARIKSNRVRTLAAPAPAAPAGVTITEEMVEAAEVAYVREIARQIDDGKTVADRSAGIRLALAAALAAAGKGT